MQKKVEKIFIGTDISRTASLVIGGSGDNIASGEIVVLDKNKNILSAGATISDTDTIYIVEGLSTTYDYVTPNGTSITDVRQLLISDPIQGNAVTEYSVEAYAAATEQTYTVNFGTLTPTVGTEYVLRIVYTDVIEDPRQFTYTYRVVATSTTLATLYDLFVAAINAHPERRIQATDNTTYITLTAKAFDDNDDVDSINEYKQVTFEVFLQSNNFASDAAVTQTVVPYPGNGTYRLVRDEEKWSQGYEGLLNRTSFPTQVPTWRTVLSETYNTIIIRHKNWYTSVANTEEQVDITTKIFIPNTATSNQTDNILAVLNPWMASLPKAFPNVSF
jgi:hypothetical protein